MKKFQKFRKNCNYLNVKLCSYWQEETQCHILFCPFFSQKVSPRTKEALWKKINESVKFNIEDFDRTRDKTVSTLIEDIRRSTSTDLDNTNQIPQQAINLKPPVSRMVCLACNEIINDDKFITIRDSNKVIIYLHSKGKCESRKDNIEEIRKKWLKSYSRYQKLKL